MDQELLIILQVLVFSLILWNDGSTIALLKAILLEFPYPSPLVDLIFECVDRAKAISSKFSVGSISYVLLWENSFNRTRWWVNFLCAAALTAFGWNNEWASGQIGFVVHSNEMPRSYSGPEDEKPCLVGFPVILVHRLVLSSGCPYKNCTVEMIDYDICLNMK